MNKKISNPSVHNIDIFNESTALIFSELYKNFPVPVYLNYESLTKKLFKDHDSVTRENNLDVLINTISWLKTSGYIWLDSESEMEVYGVVLSQKGLEVLKIIPTPSKNNSSIGEILAEIHGQTTHEERAKLINLAISEGSKLT